MKRDANGQIDLFAPGACTVPKLAPDLRPTPPPPTTSAREPCVVAPWPTADELPAPRPPNPAATRSTEEAMAVLNLTRADLIARARREAVALAREHGEVTSRGVRARMLALGLVREDSSEFWLGAVFRTADFEWTGRYATYSDSDRNIHERTIKVWRLKKT